MRKFFTLISTLAVATLLTPLAQADGLGPYSNFSAFIFGNADTPGGHSEGAVAVGKNWTMSYNTLLSPNYGVVNTTGYQDNKIGIYVGGNLTVTNKPTVGNGGNAHVKGTFTGTLDQSSGGSFSTSVDTTIFSTQETYSKTQASYLADQASKTGTSINTSDLNNWHITASNQPYQFFNINASDLSKLRTLDIGGTYAATSTLIINVIGTTVSGFGITLNGTYDHVLWNFANATSIAIDQRALHGSILAPLATVNQSQNIDGTLIAQNWNVSGSVELHAGVGKTFDGVLPNAPVCIVALPVLQSKRLS